MSRVVTFGEIMARLATPGYARFEQAMPGGMNITFAGAEASIAVSLARLGEQVAFVTALPQHEIADACLSDLRRHGVETRHILRTSHGRLGLYFLEQGVNQRGGQVIYDREGSAVSITPASAYDWDEIFAGCEWFVISGITPALSRIAAEAALFAVQEAARRTIKVVCDLNYRAKLWRWEPPLTARELATRTMSSLMPFVDVFVGGASDATALLGIENTEDHPSLAAKLTQRFPNLGHVAMTVRDGSNAMVQCFGGFLYDTATQRRYSTPAYSIAHVVDRLGAGDAFTAGLVGSFLRKSDLQTALDFATAAGSLAHSIEGDYNHGTREEIESLMQGDAGGRVRR